MMGAGGVGGVGMGLSVGGVPWHLSKLPGCSRKEGKVGGGTPGDLPCLFPMPAPRMPWILTNPHVRAAELQAETRLVELRVSKVGSTRSLELNLPPTLRTLSLASCP